MRTTYGLRITAFAVVATLALAVGCDEGGGLAFAPEACILARPDQVRETTGNDDLVSRGNKDTDFGGSVCTYKGRQTPAAVWRFSNDPITSDDDVAELTEQLRAAGYELKEPTAEQDKITAHAETSLLHEKGDSKAVRGIMTTYQDTTLVVYAPNGATLQQVTALRNLVWDGFTSQAAAAVAGQ